MSGALDNIIELMETLLKEYSNQDKQLNRIHGKLSSLKYGYNSVKRDLSTLECSMSEVLGQSSNAAVCLEEHKEETEAKISEIQTCIDEAQCTLDTVKEFSHPCGHGQWRVAVLKNYSDPCTECPPMWDEIMDDPTCRRFCGRGSDDDTEACDSATFTIEGEYQRICGRIRAYNRGDALAFDDTADIDETYLSGLSLTHGSSPRQHIWSFAIGLTEDTSGLEPWSSADGSAEDSSGLTPIWSGSAAFCPCDGGNAIVPTFVDSNYFCESSWRVPSDMVDLTILNLDDTLWDGKGCRDTSTCCDDPPFFVRTLDGPISDDLEIRMCNRLSATLQQQADIAVEFIEIYVE